MVNSEVVYDYDYPIGPLTRVSQVVEDVCTAIVGKGAFVVDNPLENIRARNGVLLVTVTIPDGIELEDIESRARNALSPSGALLNGAEIEGTVLNGTQLPEDAFRRKYPPPEVDDQTGLPVRKVLLTIQFNTGEY